VKIMVRVRVSVRVRVRVWDLREKSILQVGSRPPGE
jgi:hypothetical protein